MFAQNNIKGKNVLIFTEQELFQKNSLIFIFLLRKNLGLQKSKKKKKKKCSSTQPLLLSVILHNQQYNYRNQEINIGRILLILQTVLKFCQFHCKFPCFGPVSHPGPHTALVFRSPQALLIRDSSSIFIFHNFDILEKSVILQNVSQFRFVKCFLMIKLGYALFCNTQKWLYPFSAHRTRGVCNATYLTTDDVNLIIWLRWSLLGFTVKLQFFLLQLKSILSGNTLKLYKFPFLIILPPTKFRGSCL